jgi:4-amino-4-deoxy-L-arabinose transferase-like glycosyltransferase
MKHWPYLITALVMLVIFGCRWFGPSDLYDNDQPKTVAYTVDMVRHGRWLLPVDMLGRPSTKPPMYNWIGAPAVAAGWHNEFALKLPSTLAAVFTVLLTWRIARRTAVEVMDRGLPFHAGRHDPPDIQPVAAAAIAGICLMTNYSITKLSYTARPDMVLTAFTTAGWAAATRLLLRPSGGTDTQSHPSVVSKWRPAGLRLTLWLCVAGAALTKGPPALLLVIYVVLGAKLIGGRWSVLRGTGIAWGLPLAVGLFGAWAYAVYRINPVHFANVFMGEETVGRVGRGGVVGIVSGLWVMPVQFVAKFLPWSVFVFLAGWDILAARPKSRWFTHPLGPALLWVVLVLLFFSFSGGKRADYLAPAYPAAAVLVSLWLVTEGLRRMRVQAWRWAAGGLVLSVLICVHELTISSAAREGYGRNVRAFVRQVQMATHGQPIRFEQTLYTPVQALLGYNEPKGATGSGRDAPWLVRPVDREGAVVVSDPIWVGGKRTDLRMALYPVETPDGEVPDASR